MWFVTSCYGKAYAAYLAVFLASVRQSHPDGRVLVIHDEIPERIVRAMARENPNARFVHKGDVKLAKDNTRRIAAKLDFWMAAFDLIDADTIVFIDADTIVRASLKSALLPGSDALVTARAGRFPLNTGVVIVRNSDRGKALVADWKARTEELCLSADRIAESTKLSGGPDQATMLELIGDPRPVPGMYCGDFAIQVARCEDYNQTDCVPLSAPAKVFHFKGGVWRKILMMDRGYTAERSEEASRDAGRRGSPDGHAPGSLQVPHDQAQGASDAAASRAVRERLNRARMGPVRAGRQRVISASTRVR